MIVCSQVRFIVASIMFVDRSHVFSRRTSESSCIWRWTICVIINILIIKAVKSGDVDFEIECPVHCRCQNVTVSCTGGRSFLLNRMPRHVTKLILLDSGFTSLDADQFASTPRLEHLTIRQNNMSVIRDHAFRGLERLKVLLLDSNNLVRITPKAFSGLPALTRLSLSDNSLDWEQLNATLTDLSSVEFINLIQNNIDSTNPLPSGFSYLSHLSSLQLGLNNLVQNISEEYFAAAVICPL